MHVGSYLYIFSLYSSQRAVNPSRPPEADPEKEWVEKLFGECEDEFSEVFGVYDGKTHLLLRCYIL